MQVKYLTNKSKLGCLYTLVFILASSAKVISEHRPINVVSQPGIKPGSWRFQNNHQERTSATEATNLSQREKNDYVLDN